MDIASLSIAVNSDALIEAKKRVNELTGASGVLTEAIGLAAKAFALFKTGSFLNEVAQLSARFDTLGVVMKVVGNNAGYSMQQMEGFTKVLQAQGISMNESRQTLTRMTQAHIDLKNATVLATMAQDAAVIGDINSSEAFQRMIYGIQSGQTEVLRTIGINVSFEKSYERLAIQLKKNVKSLSEVEKTQARANGVMEKAKDIAGVYEASMGTVGKAAKSLERIWENLKVIAGSVFQEGFAVVIDDITSAFKTATKFVEEHKTEIASLGTEMANVVRQGSAFLDMLSKVTGGSKTAEGGVGVLTHVVRGLGGAMALITDIFNMASMSIMALLGKLLQGLGKLDTAITKITGWRTEDGAAMSQAGDDMVKNARALGKEWKELSATGAWLDTLLNQQASSVAKMAVDAQKLKDMREGKAASHTQDDKEKEKIVAGIEAGIANASEERRLKNLKDMKSQLAQYAKEFASIQNGVGAGHVADMMEKGFNPEAIGQLEVLRKRNVALKETAHLLQNLYDASHSEYQTYAEKQRRLKELTEGQIAYNVSLLMAVNSAKEFKKIGEASRETVRDLAQADALLKELGGRIPKSTPKSGAAQLGSYLSENDAINLADPSRKQLNDLRNQRNLLDSNREALTAMGLYEKAITNVRLAEMRLKAESGNTWAIIGATVLQHTGQATDAMVTWMHNLDGVGRSWKTLGATVKSIIYQMLIDMQKAIIQQKLMQPLFSWATSFIPGMSATPVSSASAAPGGIAKLASGTDFVPSDGLAYLHKGEKVVPASQTKPYTGSGGGVTNTVVIEINMATGETKSKGGDNAAANTQAFAKMIGGMIREEMIKQSMPNGLLDSKR